MIRTKVNFKSWIEISNCCKCRRTVNAMPCHAVGSNMAIRRILYLILIRHRQSWVKTQIVQHSTERGLVVSILTARWAVFSPSGILFVHRECYSNRNSDQYAGRCGMWDQLIACIINRDSPEWWMEYNGTVPKPKRTNVIVSVGLQSIDRYWLAKQLLLGTRNAIHVVIPLFGFRGYSLHIFGQFVGQPQYLQFKRKCEVDMIFISLLRYKRMYLWEPHTYLFKQESLHTAHCDLVKLCHMLSLRGISAFYLVRSFKNSWLKSVVFGWLRPYDSLKVCDNSWFTIPVLCSKLTIGWSRG
jgi:hypothetical protein